MSKIISLVSGIVFGVGLVISEMIDPEKVLGFLDLFGNWAEDFHNFQNEKVMRDKNRLLVIVLDTLLTRSYVTLSAQKTSETS